MTAKIICERCNREGRIMFKVKMVANYTKILCDRCVAEWMDEIPERFIFIEKIT